MSDKPKTQEESLAKLKELIDDIEIASLITLESNGELRGRPMATQQLDADAELWFFTNDYTATVGTVLAHPNVCVSYASPDKNRYVSVSGTAELVRDKAKIKELWKPSLKAWFPKGVEDPDIALLRVDIVDAQYWDSTSSKIVQVFGMLKAIVTGEDAGKELGENAKLTVRKRIGSDTVS